MKELRQKNSQQIISVVVSINYLNSFIDQQLMKLAKEIIKLPRYELIIINNGSVNEFQKIVKKLQKSIRYVRYIKLSKIYKIDIALSAGLDNSIGDYVCFINLETDPAKIISALYLKALEGYDIVTAEPINYPKNSIFGQILLTISNLFSKFFLGTTSDYLGIYTRIISRKGVNSLMKIKNHRWFFKYFNHLVGYTRTSINYELTSDKNLNYRVKNIQHLYTTFDTIISNSNSPLRLASFLCFVASIVNLLFIVYVFIATIIKHHAPEGWITTSLMSGFMFFLLFTILTVISEYLGRILNESKDQPLYFMQEEENLQDTKTNKINVV